MSKFLTEIRHTLISYKDLLDSEGWADDDVKESIKRLDSLGENARFMLEIGIVQDELVELGFTPERLTSTHKPPFSFRRDKDLVEIYFDRWLVGIRIRCNNGERHRIFERLYSNENCCTTWQQDLLTKVKELIA